MINLSIPFWLFGTIVGVICFGLLATALAIGYKVRKLKSRKGQDAQSFGMATAMLNNHFQQNLLDMQVDAVFDSLNALIETERIKLKSLVAPTLQSLPASAPPKRPASEQTQTQDEASAQVLVEPETDPKDGPAADGPQTPSGLSRAERDLVEKIQSFKAENHQKLEAVA